MPDPYALVELGLHEEAWSLLVGAGDDPIGLCYRARAAHETGRDEEAQASMARAMERAAADPFVLTSAALLALDAGEPARALPLCERARAVSPANVLLPAYHGLLLFLTGRRAEGLDLLERTLLPVPPSLQSRVSLHLEGWLGPGVETFDSCVLELQEEPDHPVFAAVNKYLVMPEDVAEWLHLRLFDRGRRAEHAAGRRAGELIGRGEAAAAVELLRSAPPSEALRLMLAEAYLAAGRPGDALEELRIAGQDEPLVTAFRAAALFRVGQAAEAVDLLGSVIETPTPEGGRVGDDFSVRYLHGLALLATARLREARRTFELAFRSEAPFVGKVLLAACRARVKAEDTTAPVQ